MQTGQRSNRLLIGCSELPGETVESSRGARQPFMELLAQGVP